MQRVPVVHLDYGIRPNRQYAERYKILHENAYDPVSDVEIDPKSGLLQWSAGAPEYFARRREDE